MFWRAEVLQRQVRLARGSVPDTAAAAGLAAVRERRLGAAGRGRFAHAECWRAVAVGALRAEALLGARSGGPLSAFPSELWTREYTRRGKNRRARQYVRYSNN